MPNGPSRRITHSGDSCLRISYVATMIVLPGVACNPSDCTWRNDEINLAVLFYESLTVVGKGDDGAERSGFINQFGIT